MKKQMTYKTFVSGDEKIVLNRKDIERFNRSFIKQKGCWVWQRKLAGPNKWYTYFTCVRNNKYKQILANRIAWILNRGQIPKGKRLYNKCGNLACINPSHYDLVNGAKPNAKLDKRQVKVIRRKFAKGFSINGLAKVYNVAFPTIFNIIKRRTWGDI